MRVLFRRLTAVVDPGARFLLSHVHNFALIDAIGTDFCATVSDCRSLAAQSDARIDQGQVRANRANSALARKTPAFFGACHFH